LTGLNQKESILGFTFLDGPLAFEELLGFEEHMDIGANSLEAEEVFESRDGVVDELTHDLLFSFELFFDQGIKSILVEVKQDAIHFSHA
jgi:hypothetical protein